MNNGQRCIHCPTPENLHCAGLDVRRFCELIDPSCPEFDSRYLDVIVREAPRAGEDTAMRPTSRRQPDLREPFIEGGETIAIPMDCCGGGVPPGYFLT
jgi:hypothetical protein